MRRYAFLLAASAPALLLAGCDARVSQITSIGLKHRVTLYSGGKAVREYVSTGKVLGEEHSDGWYFTDRDSGRLVRVSGTVTIEAL